ncbi:integrase [Aeromonas veronii]|uniref:integrase n=1 Tax=Aeromonas veronii TaxID=654 RepID=UPI0030057EE8
MDSNIFHFKPAIELNSEANLEKFIQSSKNKLTVFGEDCWDHNLWHTFHNTRRVVARFSTNLEPSTSYSFSPLGAPFIDFAKAYIRYIYALKPITNLHRHFEAIRILEEALILSKHKADILMLDGLVLERLGDIFNRRISNLAGRNKAGYQMELLLNFCRDNFITPSLPGWSNPYQKVKDLTIQLDENGKEHRKNKLPSEEDMMLFAKLFHDAPSLGIEAEYFTSVIALLMQAPSRCSELFSLPIDCTVWEENRSGELKLGIRWVPAKNGNEGIKWVPTVMQDVALEAIERLKKISMPAREAAMYAEMHPDNNGSMVYISKLVNWPFVDNAKKVKASEALLLYRDRELHAEHDVIQHSFVLPTVNIINARISRSEARKGVLLWKKHNILREDGSQPDITSHQARHWLSTKAERGGMDELTLANWAGRARVADNASYDHRTEEEKSNAIAVITIPENANTLDKIKCNLPISFEEIGKNLTGAAIVTELGVCEHDFAMIPCQRNGDCETCKELVCIKGLSSSLELLKVREVQVAAQLEKAQQSHKMGAFGADRWVSSHGWRLAHIRTKIRLLEDENVLDGTPIRIPDVYDPSPAKVVLLEKGLNIEVQSPDSIDSKAFNIMGDLLCLK